MTSREFKGAIADHDLIVAEVDLIARRIPFLLNEVVEPVLDRATGVERRLRVQIRARRGRRRRCVGHLRRRGRGNAHVIDVDAKFLGNDLRHLYVEPLPHLGAAVIEADGAVAVDMNERSGLIEMDEREGNPELHRGQRDASFQHRTRRIECGDLFAARPIRAGVLKFHDEFEKDIVLDPHVVGGAVAADTAVEICLADVERIAPQRIGNVIHHVFGEDHALRAAEAAEGGIRHRVGPHAPAADARGRIEIGVVGVKHRPVDHAERQILRVSASRVERDIDRANGADLVEADGIVDPEVMPLAGHDHVVVAVETHLARTAGDVGAECSVGGPLCRLAFLAAEAAAHAPGFDGHGALRQVEHVRNDVLHLARMLCR